MAFRPQRSLRAEPNDAELTGWMAGIGMNFAASPDPLADIEHTLLAASVRGMDDDDLRVLAVLTSWLGLHHAWVHVERLVREVQRHPSPLVRSYWAGIAHWLAADRRLARLKLPGTAALDLLAVGNEFHSKRSGPDPRFDGSPLRVPAGVLRDRPADVLQPEALARLHRGYHNRVVFGPGWRADLWTVLEGEPELSTAALARRVGCGFATAWQVARDFRVVGGRVTR